MTEYAVVLITASSQEEAQKIARTMVEERFFACANIVFPIQSIYHWQGKICDDKEALIIAKTKMGLFPSVVKRVKELHSYQVPEVLFLPVTQGSEGYLSWVGTETRAVTGQNDRE